MQRNRIKRKRIKKNKKNKTMISRSKTFNINYSAKIIDITSFRPHYNPEVNKSKCCRVDGFNIITGINSEPGLYVYFPVDCQINSEFLSSNNLFRDKELNQDKTESGLFEQNCRVRSVSLKGEKSEGFIIPVSSLQNFIKGFKVSKNDIGVDFDKIEDKILCKKYVIVHRQTNATSGKKGKKVKKEKSLHIVENQFKFHVNTTLIKKVPHAISPDSLISITEKVHGTSGISANLLCQKPLKGIKSLINSFNRFANQVLYKLGIDYKLDINKNIYMDFCSSRTVIKSKIHNPSASDGFYKVDVWGIAHNEIKKLLTEGMTIYYEIIGYLPSGGYIQKDYDYGYVPPKSEHDYRYNVNYGIRVYRITQTNSSGHVFEFSARQVQEWCKLNDIRPVIQYYYGYAKDLYPDIPVDQNWNDRFIEALSNDQNFYMEQNSPTCMNKVPHEGIVIRSEDLSINVYKLKCFKFLDKESKLLDKGESDIESES